MQPRILVIRLSSLGDIILTGALLRAIAKRHPDTQIDLLVKKEFAAIARLLPGVTSVLAFDSRTNNLKELHTSLCASGYSHVLDLHDSLRSKRLRNIPGAATTVINKRSFKRWLLVKFKVNRLRQEPDVIGRYFETAASLGVADDGSAPSFELPVLYHTERVAILCPGAKHRNKQWLPEYYREVALGLIDKGYTIEFHGAASERDLCELIAQGIPEGSFRNRCGELTLDELPITFAKAALAITNDSGLMHMAVASGTQTISIFGPTVREFGFMPRGKKAVIIENTELVCRPCTTIGLNYCPRGHFRCMRDVRPERILASALH